MEVSNCPSSLAQKRRWVVWRYVERDGKQTKVPFQPDEKPARSNDPTTWHTLEECRKALQGGRFDGLGFVLGDGITGIDLDWKEYPGEGVPTEARTIVDRLDSYVEWSPSGKGCHILLHGKLPEGCRNRKKLAPGVELEVYDKGRFFTFTAEHWEGYPDDLQECQAELEALLADLGVLSTTPAPHPVALDDQALLEKMFQAENGANIRRLWQGDTSGYSSQSEADLALCSHLLWWTNNDDGRADRLFRQSGLYRPKWDEQHAGSGKTYGEMTLEKARSSSPYRGLEAQPERKKEKESTRLVSLAADAQFWHSPDGTAWASIPVEGHIEHWPVDSRPFRLWLSGRFYRTEGKTPHHQGLKDALAVLEAKALHDGVSCPVFTRLAEHDGRIYLDLSRPDWSVVEIDAHDWRIVPAAGAPVRFRRTPHQKPLPIPERPGDLEPLKRLAPTKDWPLLLGWIIGTLNPGPGAYPLLLLAGEKGAGKSTLARMLKALVDPSEGMLRTEPRSDEPVIIAALNDLIVAFDNLSGVPPWLSDILCVVATGGALSRRQLYTDSGEVVLSVCRPVILTGIGFGLLRDDLADRTLRIEVARIRDEQRLTEGELWQRFEAAHPRILAALLDAVSTALARKAEVTLKPLPRMADWAIWAEAASPALGCAPGEIVRAFNSAQQALSADLLEGNPLAQAVLDLVSDWPEGNRQVYTSRELLDELGRIVGSPPPGWPRSPVALGKALPRLQEALRRAGVILTGQRDSYTNSFIWSLEVRAQAERAPEVESPPAALPSQEALSDNPAQTPEEGEDGWERLERNIPRILEALRAEKPRLLRLKSEQGESYPMILKPEEELAKRGIGPRSWEELLRDQIVMGRKEWPQAKRVEVWAETPEGWKPL
ncbi:hypothetical protein DNA98_01355 [Meiothermus sp. Pnk-1]|nr:hypothetical protein DNA98_01355 [Meiothermus sp. Pnk-1]